MEGSNRARVPPDLKGANDRPASAPDNQSGAFRFGRLTRPIARRACALKHPATRALAVTTRYGALTASRGGTVPAQTTVRTTSISGGPLFWLTIGPFIGMLWLFGQMIKGAILLIGWCLVWCLKQWDAHSQRKAAMRTQTAAPRVEPHGTIPDEPRDAAPPRW